MADGYASSLPTTTVVPTAQAVPTARSAAASGFIVSPLYDSIFFILSPLLALGIGVFLYYKQINQTSISIFGHDGSPADLFIGAFTFSHLFIVFFRSNGNKKIYDLYPLRFTVVPIVLFALMSGSRWIAVAMGVLATWWDVYHSSLQTFGLGRIYDQRKGNDPQVGRRLDYFLNLLLYAGPILAGACLTMHTKDFHDFDDVDPIFSFRLGSFGDRINGQANVLRGLIIGVGVPFLIYYLWSYWRYSKQGYKVSGQKVVLMAATGFCSIFTWGFNSFGQAFFIMNFFHALQYWALVWWSEKKVMVSTFRVGNAISGRWVALIVFLTLGLGYGFLAEIADEPLTPAAFGLSARMLDKTDLAFNAIVVVALMHFWYDGFIWSVRKKQI